MVIRRIVRLTDEPPQRLIASFRRTRRQAVGHGIVLGAVAGATLACVTLIAIAVRWIAGGHAPPQALWWPIFAFTVPLAIGVLVGGFLGTRVGVDADDLGIYSVPAAMFGAWTAIVDIRAERRRSRTVVVLYLENTEAVSLAAPYDGPVFAHDPGFERRFFTLLNLWETHRNWRSHP